MSENRSMAVLIQEHKNLLVIIIIGLFLLELEIFALAAMKSGRKSWLQVMDKSGNLIHETDGRQLSDFNKYYFEKTFGPFKDYQVRLRTEDIPFPFRAWFTAAVGLPLGLILLFGFIIKAYIALFHGDALRSDNPSPQRQFETKIDRILDRVSRLNIFIIGFLILAGVLAYWIVPNFITYVGRASLETVIRFKWIFMAVTAAFLAIVVWIIYLRYLLARKSMETQADFEKFKLQLEYQQQRPAPLQLESGAMPSPPAALLENSKDN